MVGYAPLAARKAAASLGKSLHWRSDQRPRRARRTRAARAALRERRLLEAHEPRRAPRRFRVGTIELRRLQAVVLNMYRPVRFPWYPGVARRLTRSFVLKILQSLSVNDTIPGL